MKISSILALLQVAPPVLHPAAVLSTAQVLARAVLMLRVIRWLTLAVSMSVKWLAGAHHRQHGLTLLAQVSIPAAHGITAAAAL